MVNQSSHAGHIPIRSCVICRTKNEQKQLLRFGIVAGNIIFDLNSKLASRGYYVCDNNNCIKKIDKWLEKRR